MQKSIIASLLLACLCLAPSFGWASEKPLSYGRFGQLTLYQNSPQPSHVVLFVSGDGGWNLGVIDMARSLAGLDALVVGIDITHYLKELGRSSEKCSYPAADFENLSKFVQMKLGFDHYRVPVLVGYSSGATLVYASLVQAPQGTFRGAISLGFCPDLPLNKPFCKGNGLTFEPGPKGQGLSFLPATELKSPWVAFQGTIDQVCDAGAVETFVKQVGSAKAVLLPKVGHGFSVQRNWLPQFQEAFSRLVQEDKPEKKSAQQASTIGDLPVVEIPASGPPSDILAIILSGDGGWASIDREMGNILAEKGIPVIGLNTLQYFWTPRQPDSMAHDLIRILSYYTQRLGKQKIVLIGYSLGADVLPFMVSRLPTEVLAQVEALVLLSPSQQVSFEFHLSDWLGGETAKDVVPIRPEVAKIIGTPILCLAGKEETDSLCLLKGKLSPQWTAQTLPGAHHFGGDYNSLTEIILRQISSTGSLPKKK